MPAPLADAVRNRAASLDCSVNDYICGLIAADVANGDSGISAQTRHLLAAALAFSTPAGEEAAKAS